MNSESGWSRNGLSLIVALLMACLIGVAYWLGTRQQHLAGPGVTSGDAHEKSPLQPPVTSASESANRVRAKQSPQRQSLNNGDAVPIPVRWQFQRIPATRVAGKDGAWLDLYPGGQESIRKFNLLHPYAWTVHSAEQIAWMAENGYPMPEEVVAADAMSDADLKDLATRGGMKASFLYYDRLTSERNIQLDQYMRDGGSVDKFVANHPDLEAEWERMYQVVRLSDSPFLGYLEASRALWASDQRSLNETAAGGLALAYFRGDDRAGNALLALSYKGDMSDEEASLAYRIASQLRNYYPLPADCGPGTSTPFPKPRVH